ncbi:MAG TPA: YggS family pyridoxal phosphate-dependent enzyme [Steroidobacteraceae bacterium]|nr:YggS family pyridoxal phosphate-dependent enzyme [Steroidobacteraceae bacterium]
MSATSPSKPPISLIDGLAATQARITAAALRYQRQAGSVTLLAVSKQQNVDSIRLLATAGQRHFGENYLQEALPKIAALQELRLSWHYIGQIQSNKTRPIAENFQWVHTLDRLKIAERLSEQRSAHIAPLNVCIQVKLADEPGKGGVASNEMTALAQQIASLPQLKLRGLMCIPPPRESFDEQFAYFQEAARLLRELQRQGIDVDTLSMGMTADLEAAIAAGATIVRVGTAIFGERSK